MMTAAPPRFPRRRDVRAAVAALATAVQLVLTPLTLALAVLFVVAGRVSRWRRSWLLAPAGFGLAWALAAGPRRVIDSFLAGPAQLLRYFSHGHVLASLGHPLGGFAAAGGWLPRQLPVALVAGAAEAAAIGWLSRPPAGQPAPPPRPGLIAVLRGALTARTIRAGAVLTRNGCALGVVRATGAAAELRWPEIAGGTVVTGPVATEVTVAGLQVVHAALRRRKPLIVADPGDDPAIARAVAAACAATGTPLRLGRDDAASARSLHERVDLVRVVSERSAVLLPVGTPQLADRACADISALAAELRRIGVDGDGLIWVPVGEAVPGPALAALVRDGGTAGLPVLIGSTAPATVTELAGTGCTELTFAPRSPARKPWQFAVIAAAPRSRQPALARMVPARLPRPHAAASPGGRP